MFSSPEKRIKKESNSIKSKKDSSERNSFENNKNIASKNLQVLQEKSDDHLASKNLTDLQEMANQDDTGLPAQLKHGVESLSGVSLDDVKVNYNSSKPSNLGASAYAEGNHIHVGGGQEKHLAHEAWHVVQQKQGRVNSTRELNGTSINDDSSLEKEATDMGHKAAAYNSGNRHASKPTSKHSTSNVAQLFGFSNPFSRKKIKEKYSSYSESEQNLQDDNKGGFLKGATRGVLGLGGGIIGGLGGLAKGIGHKAYNKATGGEDVSIMANMKAGGTAGRDAGRVAGSAIVDGTRAVAGGAMGAAGGLIGGLGGAAYGAGKKAYNKATGGEDVSIMDNMVGGAKGGAKMGYEKTNALIDIAEEVPGLGVDLTRGAVGAAGGVVGGLGGAVYGAGKKVYNKATGGENVSIMDSMVGGAKRGFDLAANSEGSKMVMKSGVSAAAALAAAPTGAGFAAGALASKGMSGYYGEKEDKQDVALASGLLGGGLGSLASGAAGTAEAALNGSTFLSNHATTAAVGTAVSMPIGMGINATHDYVDNYGKPNSKTKEETPEEKGFGEKALGNAKALGGGFMGGVGGLLGGLGGAAYGAGKKVYNKATGGEDVSIMDSMVGGAKMVDDRFGGYAGSLTKKTGTAAVKKAVDLSKTDEKNTVGNKLTERKNRVKKILGFKVEDTEKKEKEKIE